MSKLGDDMVRLAAQIHELRAARKVYVQEIRASVNQLRARFRSERGRLVKELNVQRQEVQQDLAAARRAWSGVSATAPRRQSVEAELAEVPVADVEGVGRKRRPRSAGSRDSG